MNDLILQYGLNISIIIRLIAFIILLFQIIPLQIKEAGVLNGLKKLRLLLLILGISLFIANAIALWLLISTISLLGGSVETRLIQILSAMFILIPSIALYFIYHSQYTLEAKIVHKEVDKQEKKAEKKQKIIDNKNDKKITS